MYSDCTNSARKIQFDFLSHIHKRWWTSVKTHDLRPLHKYPVIFEFATFPFRIRLPSTRIRRIRQRIRIYFSPLSRVKKINRNESDNVWTANLDISESDCVAKSCPVSYRTINQYGGTTCRRSFFRVNPDTIGCAWTGEFDLNTLRVDREIFESGKKKLRIPKYSDGRGDVVLERSTFTWYSRNDIFITEFRL